MKFTSITLFALILFTASAYAQNVLIRDAFPGISITNVVGLETANDGTAELYAVSQPGRIFRVNPYLDDPQPELWLDITSRVVSGGERGLLGLAFHPDFTDNSEFYVYYTRSGPLRSVISRFLVDEDGFADPDSETILLQFNQPFNNHNGGQIKFGPDGYLYIASGDGGSGGDPQNHGQNPQTLLGAMLRIDVDNTTGGLNYAIPEDNPFLGSANGADEIFAWGLRNPWRMSFDRETGDLWTGDVGQNAWESIYIIENGLNYGWNILEGSHCYPIGSNCDPEGLEMPIFEYNHDQGDRSITGGYVYRGQMNPQLYGKYIYGDFVSGRMWALEINPETWEVVSNTLLSQTGFNISSFGQDSNGEIYILSYGSGRIYDLLLSPITPDITSPATGDTVYSHHEIEWENIVSADFYTLQVSTDEGFEELVFDGQVFDTSQVLELDQGDYFARVRATNAAGEGGFSETISYYAKFPVSTEPGGEIPHALTITSVYPNPFNPETNIVMEIPEAGRVTVEVFDITGRQVALLEDSVLPAGTHRFTFDGSRLSSGTYIIRAIADGKATFAKMSLVK